MVEVGQIQKSAKETRFVGISARDGWRREDQEQWIVGWSPIEKRVMDAVEDYLESCAQNVVDIDVVEKLLRPDNFEVSLKYVLKHATRRGSNIFQHNRKTEPLRGKQKTMSGKPGKKLCMAGEWTKRVV